jgi:hypothetical protein
VKVSRATFRKDYKIGLMEGRSTYGIPDVRTGKQSTHAHLVLGGQWVLVTCDDSVATDPPLSPILVPREQVEHLQISKEQAAELLKQAGK